MKLNLSAQMRVLELVNPEAAWGFILLGDAEANCVVLALRYLREMDNEYGIKSGWTSHDSWKIIRHYLPSLNNLDLVVWVSVNAYFDDEADQELLERIADSKSGFEEDWK